MAGDVETLALRVERLEGRSQRIADTVRRALIMIVRILEKEFDLPPMSTN